MSQRRGLSIATATYDDKTLKQLRAPARDAEQLAGVLRDPEIGQFDRVDVLLDKPQDAIMAATHEFFSGSKTADLLVFHLTGHGLLDEDQELYFVMTQTDTKALRATALPAAWLRTQVANCLSRRVILLLDCCNAEAFVPGLRIAHGRVVMTATSAVDLAYEGTGFDGELEASLFTGALVEGLRSGDADVDGNELVSVNELHRYVSQRIGERMPAMKPRIYNFGGDIVVAKVPRRVPASDGDTHQVLEEAIRSPDAQPDAPGAGWTPPARRPRGLGWSAGGVQLQVTSEPEWDADDLELDPDEDEPHSWPPWIAWSPNGDLIFAAPRDFPSVVKVFDAETARSHDHPWRDSNALGIVGAVTPAGRLLARAVREDESRMRGFRLKHRLSVQIADLAIDEERTIRLDRDFLYHPSMCFSPDGKEIAIRDRGPGGDRRNVDFFSAADGRKVGHIKSRADIASIHWSPNPSRIAIVAYHFPHRPQPEIWERPAGGASWRFLVSLPDVAGTFVWARDGRRLAATRYESDTEDFAWTVWDATSGLQEEHWQLPPADRLAWSPDGHALVLFGVGTAVVVGSDGARRELTHEGSVSSVDWSADGRLLASGADNGVARLWDWESETELAQIAHPAPLLAVGLSPNSDHLATLTSDGVLRVWWPG